MNYPEELREKYNECMYDERDLIENFLNDTADLSMGNQMFEWHLEPAVKMMNIYGNEIAVTDIRLDKDKFVVFDGMFGKLKDEYECSDFAYSELRKVIEALPNTEDIVRAKAINDLKVMYLNIRIDYLLADAPFKYEVNGKFYTLDDVKCRNDEVSLVQALGSDTPASDLPTEVLVNLRDHIRTSVLKKSEQYNRLKEIIFKNKGGAYNFCENNTFLAVSVTPDGTDMQLPVCDISFENGHINVLVSINGTRLGDETGNDEINLVEKDLTPANLDAIIKFFEEEYDSDIMDTYNAHNPELVRKINKAWKNKKYHNLFGDILLALARRDEEEIGDKYGDLNVAIQEPKDAMDYAHEIMEGVCDDWDLETILSFIRYEED